MSKTPDSRPDRPEALRPIPAPPDQSLNLRERAQYVLNQHRFEQLDQLMGQHQVSMVELIEELRIHQAELEIQNAELQESRLKTERALSRFTRLFTMLPAAALVVNQQGLVLDANHSARQLFLLTERRSGHAFFYRLVQADGHERTQRILHEGLVNGEAMGRGLAFRRGNGERFPGDLYVARLPGENGGDEQLLCVVFDQTVLIEQRTALEMAHRQLEISHEALSQASRFKDELLANVSHELRTPLTAIIGLGSALADGVYGEMDAAKQEAVTMITHSGQQLLRMINDLLDIAKIEAGNLHLNIQHCEIAEICQSGIRKLESVASLKQQQVSCVLPGGLALAQVDPRRLRQMLDNLLENAVKFTPEGGQIGLEATNDQEAQTVQIRIRDTGIGIDPAYLNRLFEPFVQLDGSRTRSHGGTGLGLALVKRLAELQGGSLTVESALGQGSCFTLTLPQASAPSSDGEPCPIAP